MAKVIGIDLGTTNSCVSVLEGGKPIVITNSEGGRTTPSMVAFAKGNTRLVGQLAKRQSVTNALNTINSIKRFIGRRWEETESERSRVSYECITGRDNTVDVQIQSRQYTPQEISAMILQKLKVDAEKFLGETVTQVVITVPAYFTDAQRQATKDAGTIAGLEVLRIINEPTAAALAYGLDKLEKEQNILVFDLGGGTFDVSILQLGNGVFEVKATSGNNHLGGDDFDYVIVSWMMQAFQEQENINLKNDRMAIQRLREAAEKAKIELSTAPSTSINLPFITADETGPKHLEMELSRAKFEELAAQLIEKTLEPVKQALKDAELEPNEIDRLLLVGGSTRIPAVQKAIKTIFEQIQIDRSVNPDEAVALGAAIQGGVLGGEVEDLLLLDITPLSLGIETLGEVFTKIIERNTTVPTSKSQIFSTAADGQTSVEIHVLQGERAMAHDNKSLGKFLLAGIPVAPRGVPQIEVSFEMDVNGILQVLAEDKGTGKNQNITISNTGGLSGTEVEKMRQEAEAFAEKDRQRIQLVEIKNQADNLFYNYESTLKDKEQLIRGELKEQIQQLRGQIEKTFESENASLETVKTLVEKFREKLLQAGTDVYQQASPEQGVFSEDVDIDFDSTINEATQYDAPVDTPSNSKAVVQIKKGDRAILDRDTSYEDETMFDETTFEDYEVVD